MESRGRRQVDANKVLHFEMSEAAGRTIRHAHTVHQSGSVPPSTRFRSPGALPRGERPYDLPRGTSPRADRLDLCEREAARFGAAIRALRFRQHEGLVRGSAAGPGAVAVVGGMIIVPGGTISSILVSRSASRVTSALLS